MRLPLTNMKTALRLLESKQLKREQRQRYLDLLYGECERQNSLIEGTLSLVELKVDAAAVMTPTQLDDLVPAIVSTFQPLAAEKGILLGYTIPPALPQVVCPSSWLRQIILNLLNNSLKYTPPEGRVSVQATQIGDRIELTVKDTGIGIDASDLPKISIISTKGELVTWKIRGEPG
ncbi:MAG: HAMP domain-containing histidine kinase [Chloroflexaceae bacterium]|nr:HAMP domain-containing histidine kinase [Chloroflexaceae bacterium]